MRSMNIIGDTQELIRAYGKNGDHSFECIGIDFDDLGISDIKMYRYCHSLDHTHIRPNRSIDPFVHDRVTRIEKGQIVRLRELSECDTENEYKLYFSVKCDIPIEDHIRETTFFFREFGFSSISFIRKIEQCVSSCLSPGRSPITVLGVKIHDNIAHSIKTYLTLEKFSGYSQKFGVKLCYENISGIIANIFKLLCITCSEQVQADFIGRLATSYSFYPFLFGINQYRQFMEYKLYYRIRYNNFTNKQIYALTVQMMNTFTHLTNINLLGSVSTDLFETGLFMKGFALEFSKDKAITLKTYFFPLPGIRL